MNSPTHKQKSESARACPALLLSGPASGQGKTSITAAVARLHARLGRNVRVFKTGPDFLDPMILERASGHPVDQLDLWMTGEQECRALLYAAAADADLILVEGVMGLYDGNPSSADLAQTFDLPVAVAIDASAMAGTFGAVAHGLLSYRQGLRAAGVVANRVAGDYHAELLRESLSDDYQWLGALARNDQAVLPSRHLGLVQAQEVADLDARLDRFADALADTGLAELPESVNFAPAVSPSLATIRLQPLAGRRIAIARDAAFAFLYAANVRLLKLLGASIEWFSPLVDRAVPQADCLYLPGGYPELHLDSLSENTSMINSVREFAVSGRRIYAECGGMLYLLESLTDKEGRRADMAGVLPGHAQMQSRLVSLGMESVPLLGGEWRGHSFHHSALETDLDPVAHGRRQRKKNGSDTGEAIFIRDNLIASYIHAYFPSDPRLTVKVFAETSS